MDYLSIHYHFYLPEGRELVFRLRIDPHSLEAVEATPNTVPEWVNLSFRQCPNCPLDRASHPYCPAALRLTKIVDGCGRIDAYAQIPVEVVTPERTIRAVRPFQKGLGSLVGLVMATSGCPRTAFLKPMARFHLPFASEEETLYRASSMYLISQYFAHKQGASADLDLNGLAELYRQLQTVNTAMLERLRAATGRHSSATDAITALELFSHILPLDIKGSLARFRHLFTSYPSH